MRLFSGAITLALIVQLKQGQLSSLKWVANGSWSAALALFVYAAGFSFAYISLDTATGALILFASVQITMMLMQLFTGARLPWLSWLGFAVAFTGFAYLVLPDIQSPSLFGMLLMMLAGIAWGVYTLKGKQAKDPTQTTAANFLMTLPMLPLLFLFGEMGSYNLQGLSLAAASGALASGLGYSIWYMAVVHLRSEVAAISQLSVPVIAAFGGVLFVSEPITLRLAVSGLVILAGISLVIAAPKSKI